MSAPRVVTGAAPLAVAGAPRSSSPSASALRALSPAEGRAWLSALDTWLLDCDGVVWCGSAGVAGASEAVACLAALGKRVFYVSNNSTKSRAEYVHKLASVCGIASSPSQVVTSAVAAAAYCRARGVGAGGGKAYVIGQAGLLEELAAAGVGVLGPADAGRAFAFGAMAPAQLDPAVRAVVVGFDGACCYTKIAAACSYLRYGGAGGAGADVLFVATNGDLTFPDTHQLVPGGGVLVAAVAAGAGRAPDVVAGKPSLAMLDILADALADAGGGLDRARTVMVGDRLDTDIMFGAAGGLHSTLLVYTGVTRRGDVEALPAGDARRPTHELDALGALPALMRSWGVEGLPPPGPVELAAAAAAAGGDGARR